jgi:hypothetical protein
MPPFHDHKGPSPASLLKEWGTPVDDADDSIFLVENLQEFQSTNLDYLWFFAGRQGAQPPQVDRYGIDLSPRPSNLPSVGDNKILPRKVQDQRPAKRHRLDHGFLHDIIPKVRTIFLR